jgi:hypothetical protein
VSPSKPRSVLGGTSEVHRVPTASDALPSADTTTISSVRERKTPRGLTRSTLTSLHRRQRQMWNQEGLSSWPSASHPDELWQTVSSRRELDRRRVSEERPIPQRFRNVRNAAHALDAEIRDGPGDSNQSIVGPRGQRESFSSGVQKAARFRAKRREQGTSIQLCVIREPTLGGIAHALPLPSAFDPLPDSGRAFARIGATELA